MLRSPSKANVEEHSSGWEGSGRLCDCRVAAESVEDIERLEGRRQQMGWGCLNSRLGWAGVDDSKDCSAPSQPASGKPLRLLGLLGSATYDLVHPASLDFDVLEVLTVDLLGNPRKAALQLPLQLNPPFRGRAKRGRSVQTPGET